MEEFENVTLEDLNSRQQEFVFAMLDPANNGVGSVCAEIAGYAKSSAANTASKLLKNPKVELVLKREKKRLNDARLDELLLSRKEVIGKLCEIISADLNVYFDENGVFDIVALRSKGVSFYPLKEIDIVPTKNGTAYKIKLEGRKWAFDTFIKLLGYDKVKESSDKDAFMELMQLVRADGPLKLPDAVTEAVTVDTDFSDVEHLVKDRAVLVGR